MPGTCGHEEGCPGASWTDKPGAQEGVEEGCVPQGAPSVREQTVAPRDLAETDTKG